MIVIKTKLNNSCVFWSGSLHWLKLYFTPQNLNQNPRTLLPKFYGLYCIQSGGINIRLVVMNNVLPRSVKMHYKYDLKGSTYKRRASRKEREKACPTYKDLDFQDMHEEGLYFDTETYNNLMKTLQRDCRVGSFSSVEQGILCVCAHSCICLFIGLALKMQSHTTTTGRTLLFSERNLWIKQGSLGSGDLFHYQNTLLQGAISVEFSCLHSFAKTFTCVQQSPTWTLCHGPYQSLEQIALNLGISWSEGK